MPPWAELCGVHALLQTAPEKISFFAMISLLFVIAMLAVMGTMEAFVPRVHHHTVTRLSMAKAKAEVRAA